MDAYLSKEHNYKIKKKKAHSLIHDLNTDQLIHIFKQYPLHRTRLSVKYGV